MYDDRGFGLYVISHVECLTCRWQFSEVSDRVDEWVNSEVSRSSLEENSGQPRAKRRSLLKPQGTTNMMLVQIEMPLNASDVALHVELPGYLCDEWISTSELVKVIS